MQIFDSARNITLAGFRALPGFKYPLITFFCLISLTTSPLTAQQQAKNIAQLPGAAIAYELPSTKSRKVANLPAGTRIRLLRKRGEWFQVGFGKQRSGWLRLRPRNAAAANNSDRKKPAPVQQTSFNSETMPVSKGGVSFSLGFMGGDFSYIGKFHYFNMPNGALEGSFQFVAGNTLTLYPLDINFKFFLRRVHPFRGYVSGGFGVITSVPVKSAAGKSNSNLSFNYGLGLQKPIQSRTFVRFDLRQFLVLGNRSILNFLEFSAGLGVSL